MRRSIAITVILACAAICYGDVKEVMTEETFTYTGGPYKAEVFKYRLLKPAKIEAGKKYPLVIFLHGAGERGDDNVRQLKFMPERMAGEEYRGKYPCFLIAPQCRSGKKWVDMPRSTRTSPTMPAQPSHQMNVVVAALRKTVKQFPVDTRRIYLTGLSLGGYGTWDLATRHPDWFAAAAPLCGGGDPGQAKRLVGLPLWAFHGEKDHAVPVERSRTMIEAIKAAGGDPKYTEYKGAGHGIWGQTYGDAKGLMAWMFKQVRAKPADVTRKAATPKGIAALIGADSPLRKGERIAFLGDSITQAGVGKTGYVTLIKKAIEQNKADLGVAIIPAGISGHKVPDLQKRLERDVIAKKATVVFVYIGINDVWHSTSGRGTSKERFEAGLRDIIARMTKSGATVVLATPSVIGEKKSGTNKLDAMLDEYAAISRKVAADLGLQLCDLRKAFVEALETMNPDDKGRGILTGDGVHLNPAGNMFVAEHAAAAIAKAMKRRRR